MFVKIVSRKKLNRNNHDYTDLQRYFEVANTRHQLECLEKVIDDNIFWVSLYSKHRIRYLSELYTIQEKVKLKLETFPEEKVL
jgi:hypothetical protein